MKCPFCDKPLPHNHTATTRKPFISEEKLTEIAREANDFITEQLEEFEHCIANDDLHEFTKKKIRGFISQSLMECLSRSQKHYEEEKVLLRKHESRDKPDNKDI